MSHKQPKQKNKSKFEYDVPRPALENNNNLALMNPNILTSLLQLAATSSSNPDYLQQQQPQELIKLYQIYLQNIMAANLAAGNYQQQFLGHSSDNNVEDDVVENIVEEVVDESNNDDDDDDNFFFDDLKSQNKKSKF
jgi:hypothetical protein